MREGAMEAKRRMAVRRLAGSHTNQAAEAAGNRNQDGKDGLPSQHSGVHPADERPSWPFSTYSDIYLRVALASPRPLSLFALPTMKLKNINSPKFFRAEIARHNHGGDEEYQSLDHCLGTVPERVASDGLGCASGRHGVLVQAFPCISTIRRPRVKKLLDTSAKARRSVPRHRVLRTRLRRE